MERSETESTLSELQVCADTSLVCTSTAESFNATDNKIILSSDDIGEGKLDTLDETKVESVAEIGKKNKVRVPTVDANGTPLMPCTAAKAKKLLKSGKARYKWSKLGMFYLQLNYAQSEVSYQPLVLGIDPGSKFEGYSIVGTQDNTANLTVETKRWVKEAMKRRRILRNSRKARKRRRKERNNRKRCATAPTIITRATATIEIVKQLGKILPFKIIGMEDIKVRNKKAKRHWNEHFSPTQRGKRYLRSALLKMGYFIYLVFGKTTAKIRKNKQLPKSRNKLSFYSHCVDAWIIASLLSGAKQPSDKKATHLIPLRFVKRQLHQLKFKKGGKRNLRGGTVLDGIKKGSLIKDKDMGICYVGGRDKCNGFSLCSYKNGKRIRTKRELEREKILKVTKHLKRSI